MKTVKNCCYMKVTNDKFRLPVAVADSAVELARLVGTTKNTVLSSISHGTGPYEKVELEGRE